MKIVSWHRTLTLGIFALMLVSLRDIHAQNLSDYELLSQPVPKNYVRQRVIVYPLIDQRRILHEEQKISGQEQPSPLLLLLKELEKYPNLVISRPKVSRDTLRRQLLGSQELEAARDLVVKSQKAYAEVRLKEATRLGERALRRLLSLDYHVVDPKYVGRVALVIGLAHLENRDNRNAQTMFEKALLIDPGLRLTRGYDHPKAILAFERARVNFGDAMTSPPPKFGTVQRIPRNATLIKSRLTRDFFELLVVSPNGIQSYRQPLTERPIEDANRLASQLFACLPRGYSPKPTPSTELYLDTGLAGHFYAQSPLTVFPNGGISTSVGLVVFKRLSLEGNFTLSASGRDAQEHLRSDITSQRIRLAGGVHGRHGRFSGFVHLGAQIDRQSEVITTTNVACKYFSRTDGVPPILCNFDSDFSRVQSTWSVGPSLSFGGRLRLIADAYLALRISAAAYFYTLNENGLDWPISAGLALGYRLF